MYFCDSVTEIPESKPVSPNKRAKQQKPVDPRKLVEALTPIRETTFEEYDDSQRDKMESQSEQVIKMMAAAHKEQKPKEEVLSYLFFLNVEKLTF